MQKITNNQNIKAWSDATKFIINKFNDDGDFYRKHIINPAMFSLLDYIKDKKILDAGCGEGYLSRMLAKKEAFVTGIEPAFGLVTYAVEREKNEGLKIKYINEDLSSWKGKKNDFDIVISNMVFMDIPDYALAIKNCIRVLKPKGVFIISISHPCFDIKGKWEEEKPYVQVTNYFNEYKIQNYIGYSFHRMLSSYVNLVIKEGCSITKLLEPQLPKKIALQNSNNKRDLNIPNFLFIKAIKN